MIVSSNSPSVIDQSFCSNVSIWGLAQGKINEPKSIIDSMQMCIKGMKLCALFSIRGGGGTPWFSKIGVNIA